MKNKFLLFTFCSSLFCCSSYSKSIIKGPLNKLDKITLTASYPEKTSYFQVKKNSNNENELYLIIDGQTRKSRKISSKDWTWLDKRLSSFIYDSRKPDSKCQLGEISLSIQQNSKVKSLRRCIGAQDETTTKLLTLTQTLRMFL